MNIAIYEDRRYEFIKDKAKKNTILLLSNTWQQGFEIEKVNENEFYAKSVNEEETTAMWETNITLSLTQDTPQTAVRLTDTRVGDIVEFTDEKLPDEIATLIKETQQTLPEIYPCIPWSFIKSKYPDATLRKVKKDYYINSYYEVPISVMDAISSCVALTKISAHEEIVGCQTCGVNFPYNNARTPFGEVYEIICPVCGRHITKKRT